MQAGYSDAKSHTRSVGAHACGTVTGPAISVFVFRVLHRLLGFLLLLGFSRAVVVVEKHDAEHGQYYFPVEQGMLFHIVWQVICWLLRRDVVFKGWCSSESGPMMVPTLQEQTVSRMLSNWCSLL